MDPAWKREMEKLGDVIGDVILVQLSVKKKNYKRKEINLWCPRSLIWRVRKMTHRKKSHILSPRNSEEGKSTASL